MAAPNDLTPSDFQCLAALARYGRRRLQQTWQALNTAGSLLSEHAAAPLTLAPEQRSRLLQAINAQELPWRPLRELMREHGLGALLGPQLPRRLQAMPDPPLALYYLGNLQQLQEPAVAMVGARQASQRAQIWARQTAQNLATQGLVVVSGMAFGIDAAAHQGALRAAGRTVAVLGSGLLRPAPRSNEPLMRRILDQGGLVVSEYSPTVNASKYKFPERNRIVTGLSRGLVVVEAGARSGSLISARLALDQGREVMAVPGPVGLPGSVGCHRLLKQGAALVESAADVLEALGLEPIAAAEQDSDSAASAGPTGVDARMLLAHIDGITTTVDQLVARTGLAASAVAATLTLLELDGFVRRQAEGYIRSP